MKGKSTYFLSLLLLIPVLFTGCVSKPLKELTGPKWDANLTLPLIVRTKEKGTEINLDDTPNALGEEGLGLQGKSLGKFEIEPQEFGYFTVKVDELDIPPIPLAPDISVEVNETTELEIPEGLSEIKLSDRTQDDDHNRVNTIAIELAGATAGVGGLTISLTDANGTPYNATIPEGGNSTELILTNAVLGAGTIDLEVSGTVTTTGTGGLGINFTPTALEIAEMTVAGDKLEEMLDFEMDEEEIQIELGDSGLEFTALEFTFESKNIPAGLQATLDLRVEGRAENETIIGVPYETSLVLERENPETIDLASAVNPILAQDPYYLVFVIKKVSFGTAHQEITLKHKDGMDLAVTHHIGVRTKPEAVEVDELEEDLIQYAQLVMKVNNDSPLQLKLAVYLSPQDVPVNDPNHVYKEAGIKGGSQTVVLGISAKELYYLTSTGTLWHQIEVENYSGAEEVKEGDSLEIVVYAEAKVRVDMEKIREEDYDDR